LVLLIIPLIAPESNASSALSGEFVPDHMCEGIRRAVSLASAYANSSSVSNQLCKRLESMLKSLSSLENAHETDSPTRLLFPPSSIITMEDIQLLEKRLQKTPSLTLIFFRYQHCGPFQIHSFFLPYYT
jgi:hypothetical protein